MMTQGWISGKIDQGQLLRANSSTVVERSSGEVVIEMMYVDAAEVA